MPYAVKKEKITESPVKVEKKTKKEKAPKESILDFVISNVSAKMAKSGASISTAKDSAHLADPKHYLPTGIYGLDMILSKGKGIPSGRFIEVFGNEGSGKTAVSEFFMGLWKKNGGVINYMDYEKSMDPRHLQCYDVNQEDFAYPDLLTLEQGWDYISHTNKAVQEYAKKNDITAPPSLYVWDSLAQAPAAAESDEKSHEDHHMGLVARGMAKGFRKHTRGFSECNSNVIFINQVRAKIGAYGNGPKTDTPGGMAAKFAYSIRMKLAKIKTLRRGDLATGHLIEVTTTKNKHAPYPQKCQLHLSYSSGINTALSNFLFFQANRLIISGGKSGFKLKGVDAPSFSKREFKDVAKEYKSVLDEYAQQIIDENAAALSDSVEQLADDESEGGDE